MGRLFWKFFLASWLTLLMAGAGVRTVVWWRHHTFEHKSGTEALITDHHVDIFVGAGAEVLQYGGVDALRQFLQARTKPFPSLYAVDDDGHDILARPLDPKLLNLVRSLYAQQTNPEAIHMVTATDNHRYLVFAILPEYTGTNGEPGSIPPPRNWRGHPPPKPPSPWLLIMSGTLASA